MGLRKWIMMQYWRLTQVRGIYSVFYGILTLAGLYVMYVPLFADYGLMGSLTFAGLILLVFLILGLLYDRVFVMWSPQAQVVVERDPYQYVPLPIDRILWFPWISTILDSTQSILNKLDLDDELIEEVREYYSKLQSLSPTDIMNLEIARGLTSEFVSSHPFGESVQSEEET